LPASTCGIPLDNKGNVWPSRSPPSIRQAAAWRKRYCPLFSPLDAADLRPPSFLPPPGKFRCKSERQAAEGISFLLLFSLARAPSITRERLLFSRRVRRDEGEFSSAAFFSFSFFPPPSFGRVRFRTPLPSLFPHAELREIAKDGSDHTCSLSLSFSRRTASLEVFSTKTGDGIPLFRGVIDRSSVFPFPTRR